MDVRARSGRVIDQRLAEEDQPPAHGRWPVPEQRLHLDVADDHVYLRIGLQIGTRGTGVPRVHMPQVRIDERSTRVFVVPSPRACIVSRGRALARSEVRRVHGGAHDDRQRVDATRVLATRTMRLVLSRSQLLYTCMFDLTSNTAEFTLTLAALVPSHPRSRRSAHAPPQRHTRARTTRSYATDWCCVDLRRRRRG
jgi:hypothetical protein